MFLSKRIDFELELYSFSILRYRTDFWYTLKRCINNFGI